jgi:hypothetical protein
MNLADAHNVSQCRTFRAELPQECSFLGRTLIAQRTSHCPVADPFDIFPLMDALRRLGKLVEEYNEEQSIYEDVIPKYRDIELEQSLEAMAIVIGAGFVAAQSILTTTFSRVKGLATLQVIQVAGGTSLPKTKAELFQIAAYDRNGVSDISGINALANYFKHASEWPYDWNRLTKSHEVETARIVRTLGLRPGHPDNIFTGAFNLSFGGPDGISRIAKRVQEWREGVKEEVRGYLESIN